LPPGERGPPGQALRRKNFDNECQRKRSEISGN
jgi:hypothetical protein